MMLKAAVFVLALAAFDLALSVTGFVERPMVSNFMTGPR